ncbi:substrate-binding domain-containing protein [Variovorax sp. J31P207]|uniref:substrate-binding domain-containing protein n=1 Tax=Variovorax sp. J31P207 TaxID=3053510 RepID=UPI002576098B|nr:substrate-binding domain-containing protein [Variovorax sp. J31P207]MDM0071523.1 substrate-binding domain-containing protein [Variovorax sp. J31P207]
MPSISKMGAANGLAAVVLASACLAPQAAGAVDLSPKKVGLESEFIDVTKFCGTKKIRVALSVGAVNAHRQIKRAELEDEAKKCPNITEVGYADAGGNPEKELANIRSLAAQGYDIIIIEADSGAAAIPAMRDAVKAGAVVIPVEVGVDFPGKPGVDYTLVVTPNQEQMASVYAQFIVDKLKGKGNVIVWGGAPGAPQTAAQMPGWKKVFAANPGITVLEGPVISNWDPAYYQKVTTALLTKYPKIDGMYSDYGAGVMGSLRAFKAAGRPLVPVTGLDANVAQCFWVDNHASDPNYQVGFTSSWTWIDRLALRKGLAAVNGIDSTEPSIVNVSLLVDSGSTNPKLQPKCDRDVPPDVSVASSRLTREQLIGVFKK